MAIVVAIILTVIIYQLNKVLFDQVLVRINKAKQNCLQTQKNLICPLSYSPVCRLNSFEAEISQSGRYDPKT